VGDLLFAGAIGVGVTDCTKPVLPTFIESTHFTTIASFIDALGENIARLGRGILTLCFKDSLARTANSSTCLDSFATERARNKGTGI
jgi:hypothetical protein